MFYQLLEEIENHISANPESKAAFYHILHDYQDRGIDSLTTIEKLFSEVNLDEKYRESIISCSNSMFKEYQPITKLRQSIIEFSESKEIQQNFSKVLSLHFEGLFSSQSLIEYFSHVDCEDEEKKEMLMQKVHQYSWSVKKGKIGFFKSLTDGHSILSMLPTEFFVSQVRSLPEELQFLATCGVFIQNPQEIQSLVKCLKLYGSQIISTQAAAEWISSINEYIGSLFVSIACSSEPFILHPGNVYRTTTTYLPSDLMSWVFGEPLFIEISKMQKLECIIPLEAVRKQNSSDLEEKENANIAPQIAEMKCNQFYLGIKNISKACKDNDEYTQIPAILFALYGENVPQTPSKEKKEKLSGIIVNHCFKLGRESQKLYDEYINRQEQNTSPTKPYWRILYKSYISKSSVLRRLVLTGLQKKVKESNIRKAYSVIQEISKQVEGINETVDVIIKLITTSVKGKSRYCCSTAACAVFYIYEIAKMIEDSDNNDNASSIASTVLKEEPPYADYGEKNLCNVDIPVKHVLGCIGSLKSKDKESIVSKDMFSVLEGPDNFIFAVEAKNEKLKMVPIINPTISK